MLHYIKFFLMLFLLLCIQSNVKAQTTDESDVYEDRPKGKIIGNDIMAASTDCTDGTQFFVLNPDEDNRLAMYLVRNGKLLYSDSVDYGSIGSIVCSKHAIIYSGTGGNTMASGVLYYDYENDYFVNRRVEGAPRPNKIMVISTEKSTSILSYGEDPWGAEKVNRLVLDKAMLIPERDYYEPISVDTTYTSEPMHQSVKLTTVGGCAENSLSTAGYMGEDNKPRLGEYIYGGEGIGMYLGRDGGQDGTSLPFVATNIICLNFPDLYFFGKENGKLRAGRIINDKKTGKTVAKIIPLSEAPVKPYIK